MMNLTEANSPIYSCIFREPNREEDVLNKKLWNDNKEDVTNQSNIDTEILRDDSTHSSS